MESLSFATLSLPLLHKIIDTILEKLKTKNPSVKDLELVNIQLSKLIELTHGTGFVLGKYITLLSLSTKAEAQTAEMLNVIDDIPKKAVSLALAKLIDDRMVTDLSKGGIEKIHEFREDYEKVQEYFYGALDHFYNAQRCLEEEEDKNAYRELRHANQQLGKMIVLINRRIEEQIFPLTEAYRILLDSKK